MAKPKPTASPAKPKPKKPIRKSTIKEEPEPQPKRKPKVPPKPKAYRDPLLGHSTATDKDTVRGTKIGTTQRRRLATVHLHPAADIDDFLPSYARPHGNLHIDAITHPDGGRVIEFSSLYRGPLTPERQQDFLKVYRQMKFLTSSAHLCGIAVETIEKARANDKAFNAECIAVEKSFNDDLLRAATQRGIHGVPKPVIGGQFRDEIVAYEQVYSDGLLTTLMKNRHPDFRDGDQNTSQGPSGGGGVLVVPTRHQSIDSWATAEGQNARGQKPPTGGKR